jgi:hypothetical protein
MKKSHQKPPYLYLGSRTATDHLMTTGCSQPLCMVFAAIALLEPVLPRSHLKSICPLNWFLSFGRLELFSDLLRFQDRICTN